MRLSSRSGLRALIAAGAVTLGAALAGCGALPPQAPLAYAQKLNSATSGISTACGFAYQTTAFPGDHARDLSKLEATATAAVRKLVVVFHRNREWVYQGDTVAEISSDAVSLLDSCGLHGAAHTLRRSTTASG